MRSIFFVISFVIFSLSYHAVAADGFFIDRVSTKGGLTAINQKKLERILQDEAKKVLPGDVVTSKQRAATVIKPVLMDTRSGLKLALQRYDLGDLFSTIEVAQFDAVKEAEWDRVCSRAVRDLIYGNFRQPTPEPQLRPVATR